MDSAFEMCLEDHLDADLEDLGADLEAMDVWYFTAAELEGYQKEINAAVMSLNRQIGRTTEGLTTAQRNEWIAYVGRWRDFYPSSYLDRQFSSTLTNTERLAQELERHREVFTEATGIAPANPTKFEERKTLLDVIPEDPIPKLTSFVKWTALAALLGVGLWFGWPSLARARRRM